MTRYYVLHVHTVLCCLRYAVCFVGLDYAPVRIKKDKSNKGNSNELTDLGVKNAPHCKLEVEYAEIMEKLKLSSQPHVSTTPGRQKLKFLL